MHVPRHVVLICDTANVFDWLRLKLATRWCYKAMLESHHERVGKRSWKRHKLIRHLTQVSAKSATFPKKKVNSQVLKHVFALLTITTPSRLHCCSKGAVSRPRGYQFWTLLSRHTTCMGKASLSSRAPTCLKQCRKCIHIQTIPFETIPFAVLHPSTITEPNKEMYQYHPDEKANPHTHFPLP